MKELRFIPNALTLANLSLGVLGIFFATHEQMVWAAYCIFIAAVFDLFDGLLARALKAQSNLGKQLDSLADMVSFGVLPGVMIFQFIAIGNGVYFTPLEQWSSEMLWACTLALAIPIGSALRLGKFNESESKHYFNGLPTPAVAILVASFPLILESQFRLNFYQPHLDLIYSYVAENQNWQFPQFTMAKLFFSPLFHQIFSVSLLILMLSPMPMIALKFRGLSWKNNKWIYTVLIWFVVCLIIFVLPYQWTIPISYEYIDFIIIPIGWMGYMILSILYAIFGNRNKRQIDIE